MILIEIPQKYIPKVKNPKFVLSNERVDRSRIIVSVNSNGVTDTYSLSTDVSSITASSKVYYTQENEEGFLELYFGDKVLIYHSKLNAKERGQAWQRIANGEACVVLGVRSSVFLPFKNLELIIVDEEHDFSYKQQEPAPRYNARDCALVMAKYFKSNVLLTMSFLCLCLLLTEPQF